MSSPQDDLVVEVRFDIEKDAMGYPKSRDAEALLCSPLSADCSACVVKSVPFYLRNVAYGDTISTEDSPSGALQVKEITKRGGYSVYRVLLHDPAKREQLINDLLDFGVLLEQDGDLIALAVPPEVDSTAIIAYLLEGKGKGHWGTQDGFIFEES